MITSDTALIDTNVLVYAADATSPFHEPSRTLRDKGVGGEISLCVFPQILNEFFAVITSSRRVRNPSTQAEAVREIEKYLHARHLLKLSPGHDVTDIMLGLLKRYEVIGPEVFDVHLVAAMLSNSVTRIYTYNRDHFSRFSEIEVHEP